MSLQVGACAEIRTSGGKMSAQLGSDKPGYKEPFGEGCESSEPFCALPSLKRAKLAEKSCPLMPGICGSFLGNGGSYR